MRKIISCLMLVLLVFGMCACSSPEESIVGTWTSRNTVLGIVTETVYTFNEDGTGTKSNVLDIDFTYAFSEEKLSITTTTFGIEITEEYSYEFKDSKLVLTGENDTISLEKVK